MIEKYGVEFQALTDKFKTKMQELANDIRSFGKEAEEETTVMPKLVDTGYQKQIEYVKSQMQDIRDLLDRADAGEEIGKDTMKLEADYETLSYKLEDLIEKQKEFNGELEETNETSNGMSINLGNMFDKSISKIKRFTYYLLGARSVFSLFMKYQSIYYQYNEGMQYQAELSRNAIALSLAPAFEFLGNMVAYASIAFAKFIELLTGVNVLSKVSTKGIRDYNKSLKETQTLVSGIDEITNLTNPQNLGLASQYKALADFQKKIAEVNKWFDDNPWITSLANGLKTIVEYISDHWDIFKYIIGGVAISSFLGFSMPGGKLALAITLTGLGLVTDAVNKIKELKELTHSRSLKSLNEWPNVFKTIIDRLNKSKKGTKEWETQVSYIKEAMSGVLSTIVNGKLDYEEYKPVIDDIVKKLQALGDDTFTPEIDFLLKLTGNKDDIDFIKGYIQTGKTDVKVETTPQKSTSQQLTDNLYKAQKGDSALTQIVKGTAGIMDNISTGISNWLGKKLGIPGFANGLDYVPYDNYPAVLHKGETVVPAKYNPTIHSIGNEQTNSLLETLIVKVDNLSNRPNEFNVDGQRLARTMYPLLQNEGRNYTYNEGVSR